MVYALGYCAAPTIYTEFSLSVNRLLARNRNFLPEPLVIREGPLINRGRNNLTILFLSSPAEWLLMVDTDHVFEPEDVARLILTADEPGVYGTPHAVAPIQAPNQSSIFGSLFDEKTEKMKTLSHDVVDNGPYTVDVVPGGVMLIHRDVLEKLAPYPFNLYETQDGRQLGEDVSFSIRAKNAGFPLIMVPQCDIGHIKPRILRVNH